MQKLTLKQIALQYYENGEFLEDFICYNCKDKYSNICLTKNNTINDDIILCEKCYNKLLHIKTTQEQRLKVYNKLSEK